MKILVSGSTGFIGSGLVPVLTAGGNHVIRLARSQPKPGEAEIFWDPGAGALDAAGLEGLDGVVHLVGESLVGRWTPAKKARIRNSRVNTTRLLSEALAKLEQPPKVLVCASAVGYYGDRGVEILREDSPPGTDFLATLCREWEAAADPARDRGIRVVHLRIGFVVSAKGGGLAKMLPPFRMGLGGPIGTGGQYVSWITREDLVGAIRHALTTESTGSPAGKWRAAAREGSRDQRGSAALARGAPPLEGPVNAVTPNPVTNREFAKTLGRVLGRPAFLAMPARAVRLIFGELADALLLASQRVEPARLLATGYEFRHPNLESALRHTLGK